MVLRMSKDEGISAAVMVSVAELLPCNFYIISIRDPFPLHLLVPFPKFFAFNLSQNPSLQFFV